MNRSSLSFAALFTLLICAAAYACNVPVFRYALERWPQDAYEVLIFHDGPLMGDHAKLAKKLEKEIVADDWNHQNYFVHTIDISKDMTEEEKAYHKAAAPKSLPWLFVQYPRSGIDEPPAYAGELVSDVISTMADSPTRKLIAKSLLEGESIVWLMVESGDKAKDDATAEKLEKEIKLLAKELKLPELDESDAEFIDEEVGPKLRLSFKTIRMSRDAKGEAMFLRLLENWDPKAVNVKEPMAYAFFGRGRVLPALVGEQINPDLLAETCMYLTGPCSCQIKEQNPGFDVLMAVDWSAVMRGGQSLGELFPSLTTVREDDPDEVVVKPDSPLPGSVPESASATSPTPLPLAVTPANAVAEGDDEVPMNLVVLVIVAVGVLVLVIGTMAMKQKES